MSKPSEKQEEALDRIAMGASSGNAACTRALYMRGMIIRDGNRWILTDKGREHHAERQREIEASEARAIAEDEALRDRGNDRTGYYGPQWLRDSLDLCPYHGMALDAFGQCLACDNGDDRWKEAKW